MASGYRSSGLDFDDLFDPYVSGTKSIVTGRRVNGVDLRERYAPLSVGSKRADVGYRVDGVDVSNLWAAKGTASYGISGLDGRSFRVAHQANTTQQQTFAAVNVALRSDGKWQATGSDPGGARDLPDPVIGDWLTWGGSGSDYELLIDVSSSGHADRVVGNGAESWVSLGTSRSVTLSLPAVPASNATARDASASVRIRVRRASTGAVISDNRLTLSVYTNGWL